MPTQVAQSYGLGPVSPLVEAVANFLGPMFGITTIYGHRATGSVPDSDHPKGKALDFMVPSLGVGDRLANFAAANAKRLGVKYIVWNRRSWNPERGTWVAYTSTSNPHIDHVHISFKDKNDGTPISQFASGFLADVTGGLQDTTDIASNVLDPFGIATITANLVKPDFWRRIATGGIGVMTIIAGLVFIARRPIGNLVSAAGGLASTAVQGAAFGVGAGAASGVAIGKAGVTKPVSATPVTAPTRVPRPPAIEPPSNAPTTSALPPEMYAPVSSGGTYQVTAVGRAANPTEYRRPKGGSLLDIAGKRNPAPQPKKKVSKKGTHVTNVTAPMRQEPYGGL